MDLAHSDSQLHTTTTSFKDLSNVVISSLDEIGTRTGTHIRPPRDLQDRVSVTTCSPLLVL